MKPPLKLTWPFMVAGGMVAHLGFRLFISYRLIYKELKFYGQESFTWEGVWHLHQMQTIIYAILVGALLVYGIFKLYKPHSVNDIDNKANRTS